MHHQKISADNPVYEEDENEIKDDQPDSEVAGGELKQWRNSIEQEGDMSFHDQPIYMKKESSATTICQTSVPDLLIELDILYLNPRTNSYCWTEKSRWIIYEEDFDMELRRFNNPHLSTLSVRGLKFFKDLFKDGYANFKCDVRNNIDVLNTYSESVEQSNRFNKDELKEIRNALILNHFHVGMHLSSTIHECPTIHFNEEKQCFETNENYIPHIGRRRNRSSITLNENMHRVQSQKKLSECLPTGSEGALIQVGILPTIERTHSLFMRLDQPVYEDGLLDTYCPLRIIFIIFGPKSREEELLEVGRVFGIMLSNREFREMVYRAESKLDVISASKQFVENSALVHLNRRITHEILVHCLPQLKYYANKSHTEQHQKHLQNIYEEEKRESTTDNKDINIEIGPNFNNKDKASFDVLETQKKEEPSCSKKVVSTVKKFFPPFYQLYIDLKGNKERYLSDFRDGFTKENAPIIFTGIVFAYFVVLSPAITFGALFNKLVSPNMTITMLLVSSGTFQLLYVLINGQPLEIVGVTPTVFIVEQVLASLAISLGIPLELMRFWIGVYLSILGFVFTMFNGAIIVPQFRRSVEEVYNFYYSIIYLLSALFTMFKALPYFYTLYSPAENSTLYINERDKFGIGGTTLFLALLMLNFCLYLVKINRGIYLRHTFRKLLGAFNVPLGIILVTALNYIFFNAFRMPTLSIPDSNKINISMWVNIPDFSKLTSLSTADQGYCFLIGITMFIMLVVEVATNSISVTKVERKLKKKTLYALNMFCLITVFPIISIFLGWPFFSGAMVRSNAHCLSMAKWSANAAPGIPKRIIGHCEQRISGMIVGILVFCSVFLGSILKYIPMASMYGMFLYMGVMGISDMVLWKRLVNLMQRRKHWNEHDYLKGIPLWNIRTLVIIQLFFVIILIIIYVLSQFTTYVWTLFLFPIFVGIYAMIRGYALPRWPRLNTHLSKMDKKHFVKLYDGKKVKSEAEIVQDNQAFDPENNEDSSNSSEEESGIY
uniref:Slc4a-7 n=1 Tax=Schmidtea mediterranea TaxID=79327 RepID=A0A0H3YF42_SCHMD|nr:slc4a-7 [Schmidtea mediterranea]